MTAYIYIYLLIHIYICIHTCSTTNMSSFRYILYRFNLMFFLSMMGETFAFPVEFPDKSMPVIGEKSTKKWYDWVNLSDEMSYGYFNPQWIGLREDLQEKPFNSQSVDQCNFISDSSQILWSSLQILNQVISGSELSDTFVYHLAIDLFHCLLVKFRPMNLENLQWPHYDLTDGCLVKEILSMAKEFQEFRFCTPTKSYSTPMKHPMKSHEKTHEYSPKRSPCSHGWTR